MKRNFESESILNILMRTKRAILGRMRGFIYKALRLFSKGTGGGLYFGWGARIINSKSIKLGNNVHFGMMARLECHGTFPGTELPKIIVGENTSFGDYCHIGALKGVYIGSNVLGGSGITIIDHNHGNPKSDLSNSEVTSPKTRELTSKGVIIIGDNVWICDGVVILAGCSIGSDSVIAANVVVTKSVPPKTIFLGEK